MKKNKIPQPIKEQVINRVQQYNLTNNTQYQVHFRSNFVYLERLDRNVPTRIGRLKYRSDTQDWDFAVFKYSSEKYAPNEWGFPGQELLDGTIEGAMKAGMEIYPPSPGFGLKLNFWGCLLLIFIVPVRLLILGFRKFFGR